METVKHHFFKEPKRTRGAWGLFVILLVFTALTIVLYLFPELGINTTSPLGEIIVAPLLPTFFVAAEIVPKDRIRIAAALRACGYICVAILLSELAYLILS